MNADSKRATAWPAALVVVVAALAAAWWFVRGPTAAPQALAPPVAAAAAPVAVFAGQVYPDRLALLQRPDDAASAPLTPTPVSLLALQAAAVAVQGGALVARPVSTPGPLRPVAWAGMPLDPPLRCDPLPANTAASAPPAATSGPRRYAAPGDWQEYFDPGMPDQCEPDDGLLLAETDRTLPASFPVLAVSGFGPLTPDHSVADQPRPLSAAEQAELQRALAAWKAEYREVVGKDYQPADNPEAEPGLLDQARLLAVWRDTGGRVVLRAAHWSRASLGQHLYRLLVVDQLDGAQVTQRWLFTRHLGGL